MRDVLKVGVIGYSKQAFDNEKARDILRQALKIVISQRESECVEIVSGYTNIGVPRIAYEIADRLGLVTVGFSAKQALHSSSGLYPVQKKIIIGEKYGDESIAFINYINILIRVGGGKQSFKEVALFKEKYGEKIASNNLWEYSL